MKFKEIYTIFQNGTINSVNEAQVRMAVIGFIRDLRGIALACTKKSNYQLFLNWWSVLSGKGKKMQFEKSLPNVFVWRSR